MSKWREWCEQERRGLGEGERDERRKEGVEKRCERRKKRMLRTGESDEWSRVERSEG